jgi:hypothetical protein
MQEVWHVYIGKDKVMLWLMTKKRKIVKKQYILYIFNISNNNARISIVYVRTKPLFGNFPRWGFCPFGNHNTWSPVLNFFFWYLCWFLNAHFHYQLLVVSYTYNLSIYSFFIFINLLLNTLTNFTSLVPIECQQNISCGH